MSTTLEIRSAYDERRRQTLSNRMTQAIGEVNRAHKYFDRIWQSGTMLPPHAYQWLYRVTGQEHIGDLTPNECRHLIEIIREQFPHLFRQRSPH